MGAWDVGTFDNDAASDWAYELAELQDLSLVAEAIERVLCSPGEHLRAEIAREALAACEVVARLHGHWGARTPHTEVVDAWVRLQRLRPSLRLARRALSAIDRVLTPPCELIEIWSETDRHGAWLQSVLELRGRVAAPAQVWSPRLTTLR
jgi:hypothetical protein